jgi:hypothetical protein
MRCYNAAMKRPFQFSMLFMFGVVAALCLIVWRRANQEASAFQYCVWTLAYAGAITVARMTWKS